MRVVWIALAAVAGIVAGNLLPNWGAVALAAVIVAATMVYVVQRRKARPPRRKR